MPDFIIEIKDIGKRVGNSAQMVTFKYPVVANDFEEAQMLARAAHARRDPNADDPEQELEIRAEALIHPRSNAVVNWSTPPDVMRLDAMLVRGKNHLFYTGSKLTLTSNGQRIRVTVIGAPIDDLAAYYFVLRA